VYGLCPLSYSENESSTRSDQSSKIYKLDDDSVY